MVIALFVGVVLGGSWANSVFGAAVGAALAWLLVRSTRQARELAALRELVKSLQGQALPGVVGEVAEVAAVVTPPLTAQPVASDSVAAAEPIAFVEAPSVILVPMPPDVEAALLADARLADPSPPSNPPASPSLPPAPPTRDWLAPVKAWLFGGNTIVKAGVAILFIGLAFLAKLASEHVSVPIELRLAAVAGVALALLVIGWRLRHSRPGYAQVLQGGAVAVMYLTLYVAFRFYGVLGVGPVFALMVVVAALAAALAVLQDARSLAVIGALGGFATPLLVSSGGGNHVALFGYYLVLDLGIAAVAWFRTWRSLNLIGFLFTFVVGTAWGVLDYSPAHYASSQAFLIVFFLLFVAILLLPLRRPAAAAGWVGRVDALVPGSLLFGLPTIAFVLQHGLVRDTSYGTALSALVLAAFYVGLATLLRRRAAANPGLGHAAGITFDGTLAIAIVFLTLVIPFALDARSTAGAWALEAAALVWLGFRQARAVPRVFGYLLFLLSALAMGMAKDRYGLPTTPVNANFINALIAAAGALVAALAVHRHADRVSSHSGPDTLSQNEPVVGGLLIGLATLWLAGAAALQIDLFIAEPQRLAAWLAAISAIALLYTLLARRLDWAGIAIPALAHAPLLLLLAAASAAAQTSPAAHGGWWAWPLALLVHLVLLRFTAPRWPALATPVIHGLGAVVLALLGALQGRAITAEWGDLNSAWRWLGWLALPAALLLWLPRPAAARRWPVSAAPAAYQTVTAGLLALGALLWSLVANIASDGSAQPLPHVPLLNPLDLGIALALFAAWAWRRSEAARPVVGPHPGWSLALLSGGAFVWLNAMLVRGFHHYAGVPYEFDAWVDSLAVQTGLTLLWTVTALALMWMSARRAQRLPWLVGAGLLAAVVLKLLLVDLSGSGTVARIVSFIGVGVLMLVIGYVAPLPAKEVRDATA